MASKDKRSSFTSAQIYDREKSIEITGTYHTREAFVISAGNIVGEAVFSYIPYNRIFADVGTAASFFQMDV